MENSFLDYAMSVIMSRALPDVRDGLKPVHRRIIWDMDQQGFRPDRPFVKCARVSGDTMARYHPHGDGAIYDALVRMAQPFSLRHPLIDFHGNYGSPDFGPAASRYTECRLHPLAMQLLADIDEDTVDLIPNYDGSTEEPRVLPARFPNLLVNGSQGIAVGMATNIPPHNLGEVIDATIHLIDNPAATPDDLMTFVKGPDFPTGASILGRAGIMDAYRTGRGSVKMRATATIDENRRGGHRDRRHRAAVPDELLVDRRPDPGARRRRRPRGHRRRQRRLVRRQDRARHHAQARRQRQRRAQQAVQADPAADELLDQHGRPRRRRAPHAQPAAGARRLRRPPGRGHHPALQVPPAEGPRPRAHPRGPHQGARRHRRDHRPHPGQRRSGGGQGRPDGRAVRVQRASGRRHPRHAAAPADPAVAHRPGDRAGRRAASASRAWRRSSPTTSCCATSSRTSCSPCARGSPRRGCARSRSTPATCRSRTSSTTRSSSS